MRWRNRVVGLAAAACVVLCGSGCAAVANGLGLALLNLFGAVLAVVCLMVAVVSVLVALIPDKDPESGRGGRRVGLLLLLLVVQASSCWLLWKVTGAVARPYLAPELWGRGTRWIALRGVAAMTLPWTAISVLSTMVFRPGKVAGALSVVGAGVSAVTAYVFVLVPQTELHLMVPLNPAATTRITATDVIELGDSTELRCRTQRQWTTPVPATGWVDLSASYFGACAKHSTGEIVCIDHGCLFQPLTGAGAVKEASTLVLEGSRCVLESGRVRCWPRTGAEGMVLSEPPEAEIVELAASESGELCARLVDHSVRCWDDDGSPLHILDLRARSLVVAQDFVCGVSLDADAVACRILGSKLRRELVFLPSDPERSLVRLTLAPSPQTFCALQDDNSLACWGGRITHEPGARLSVFVESHPDNAGFYGTHATMCVPRDSRHRCWGLLDPFVTRLTIGQGSEWIEPGLKACGLRGCADEPVVVH